jgi:DNA-binding ferritin-like protein
MSAADVNFFFQLREQIKLYHWQTHSYARHKATDETLSALDETIDEYVETYMGKYGRPKVTASTNTIRVGNLSEKSVVKFIKTAADYLQGPLTKRLNAEKDTDLLNLRDEMLGDLNKLQYLFTLH